MFKSSNPSPSVSPYPSEGLRHFSRLFGPGSVGVAAVIGASGFFQCDSSFFDMIFSTCLPKAKAVTKCHDIVMKWYEMGKTIHISGIAQKSLTEVMSLEENMSQQSLSNEFVSLGFGTVCRSSVKDFGCLC